MEDVKQELTEDALVAAIEGHRDDNDRPLAVSRVVCGSRAALRARRILAPGDAGPFAGAGPSYRVVEDRTMAPDDWRVE